MRCLRITLRSCAIGYTRHLLELQKPYQHLGEANRAVSKIVLPLQRKHSATSVRRSIREGEAISSGVQHARDLANMPGNILITDSKDRPFQSIHFKTDSKGVYDGFIGLNKNWIPDTYHE